MMILHLHSDGDDFTDGDQGDASSKDFLILNSYFNDYLLEDINYKGGPTWNGNDYVS